MNSKTDFPKSHISCNIDKIDDDKIEAHCFQKNINKVDAIREAMKLYIEKNISPTSTQIQLKIDNEIIKISESYKKITEFQIQKNEAAKQEKLKDGGNMEEKREKLIERHMELITDNIKELGGEDLIKTLLSEVTDCVRLEDTLNMEKNRVKLKEMAKTKGEAWRFLTDSRDFYNYIYTLKKEKHD